MSPAPALSVFDLVTIPDGSTARATLAATLDLARRAEAAGYRTHWFGEHHLGRGRAGSAPAVLAGAVAAATTTLQVGAAVAVLPHHRPFTLTEQFGTLAELYPGRVRLGLGRGVPYDEVAVPDRVREALALGGSGELEVGDFPAVQRVLLQADGASAEAVDRAVAQVAGYLTRPVARLDGEPLVAAPGYGSDLVPWLFGFGSARSAELAGRLGLPFAVNHHVGTGLRPEAVAAYRAAFRPSAFLDSPRVAVSVHAVVAATDHAAERAARAYPGWLAQIVRRGFSGPVVRPSEPVEVPEPVAPSVALRLVGSPSRVADQVAEVAARVDAEEVLVQTVVASHDERLSSYELLAEAWRDRASTAAARVPALTAPA